MKTLRSNPFRISLVIAALFLYYCGWSGLFQSVPDFFLHYFPSLVSGVLTCLVWSIPVFVVLWLLHGFHGLWESVGLRRGFVKGISFGFFFTLPMFIGRGIAGYSFPDLNVLYILLATVFSGILNEFFYRGFAFGQLFRYCGIGFFPAVLIGVLPIGLGSYFQGNDLMLSLGVIFNAALVALFYAWIYVEWNYNLWITIGLNIFMSGVSILSYNGIQPSGSLWSNVSYFLTVALVAGYTIYYKNKHDIPYFITTKNMWINRMPCKSDMYK